MNARGRVCPLSYRHGADAMVHAPSLETDVAWIADGLYGNVGAWRARFTVNWPPGSPAHDSYFGRLGKGPAHEINDARPG